MSNTTFFNRSIPPPLPPRPHACRAGGWPMYPPTVWWKDDDLFSYVMPVTMLQFTLFVILSQGIFQIFRPLKQIKFVCYTLAGILMGPSFFGNLFLPKHSADNKHPDDKTTVRTVIAYIGMTYYVFVIAVKLDFGMISRMRKRSWMIGVSSILAPFLTMILTGVGLLAMSGQRVQDLLLLATIAYNLSSTPSANLAAALDELDLLTTDLGELSISCSLINDLITWIFLAMTAILRQKDPSHFIYTIISTCIILIFVVGVLRPFMLWIIDKTPEGQPIEEGYIVGILVAVIGLRIISEASGGNALQGPLLFGLIIPAGPPLGTALTERSEMIVSELLMPFYYMEIGAGMNLGSINLHEENAMAMFIGFEAIIILGYIMKFASTMLSSLYTAMSFQQSLKLSLFMSIRGIIEFIIYQFFKAIGRISEEQQAALIFSALAQTALITPLIKVLCKSDKSVEKLDVYFAKSLQTTPLASELRILSCVHHEDDVPAIITLLEASNCTSTYPVCAYVIHMIELYGQSAPMLIPHKQHRRRCSHNGCRHIMAAFKNYSANSDLRVTVQPFTLIAPFRSMHEGISRIAREKHIPLVLIPFIRKDDHGTRGGAFNSIISRLQENAPCTIGVIVYRGSRLRRGNRRTHVSFRVGVFFIGGEDDREALAYASRMLGHLSVAVTLHYIQIKEETCVGKEKKLDEDSIEEFILRNMNNPRAVFQHLEVEDWEHALKAIRSTSESYDLVMVGRRQSSTSRVTQEMFSWTENPELGVIGDTMASLKHSDHMTSVLVIQHSGEVDTISNTPMLL